MKSIIIQHTNLVAHVDDQDFDMVVQYTWYLYDFKQTKYACTSKALFMHRLIVPEIPEGLLRAHRDNNGLNNQRHNIVITTNMENLQHKGKYKNNTSGTPGVKFNKGCGWWEAQIGVYGKRIGLGTFRTKDEAIAARHAAEQKYRKPL